MAGSSTRYNLLWALLVLTEKSVEEVNLGKGPLILGIPLGLMSALLRHGQADSAAPPLITRDLVTGKRQCQCFMA